MLATFCVLLPAIVVAAQQTQAKLEVTVPLRRAPVEAVAGEWKTEGSGPDAVITHDGTKWTAKEGFPLALFRQPSQFSNGMVWIDFKLIAGGDDHTAGLVFGHQGSSYFYVRYNTKDGNVALWRMDGPKRSVIKHGEGHQQLPKGEWHRLQLTVNGRKIRAFVNPLLFVEHELEQPAAGRLGLWTKPDATSAFRNLQVFEPRH
jgi:hypothetical protein